MLKTTEIILTKEITLNGARLPKTPKPEVIYETLFSYKKNGITK